MNTGRWGETLAAWYLFFHGCRILERNWRYGRYEIDIVARERRTGVLIFAEVKTRSSTAFGRPADAVTARSRSLWLSTAMMIAQSVVRKIAF